MAIILCATSLGVLVPVLKDAGEISSPFGQLVIAAASIADFGAIILLTLFFSGEGGTGSTLLLLGSLFLLAAVVFVVVRGAERSMRIRSELIRLQDTTAQIRVRAAMVLFLGFAAIAAELGLEAILGAFVAGAIISLVDRDEAMTHREFRRKLDAVAAVHRGGDRHRSRSRPHRRGRERSAHRRRPGLGARLPAYGSRAAAPRRNARAGRAH